MLALRSRLELFRGDLDVEEFDQNGVYASTAAYLDWIQEAVQAV